MHASGSAVGVGDAPGVVTDGDGLTHGSSLADGLSLGTALADGDVDGDAEADADELGLGDSSPPVGRIDGNSVGKMPDSVGDGEADPLGVWAGVAVEVAVWLGTAEVLGPEVSLGVALAQGS